jgi:hypothetical protein
MSFSHISIPFQVGPPFQTGVPAVHWEKSARNGADFVKPLFTVSMVWKLRGACRGVGPRPKMFMWLGVGLATHIPKMHQAIGSTVMEEIKCKPYRYPAVFLWFYTPHDMCCISSCGIFSQASRILALKKRCRRLNISWTLGPSRVLVLQHPTTPWKKIDSKQQTKQCPKPFRQRFNIGWWSQ